MYYTHGLFMLSIDRSRICKAHEKGFPMVYRDCAIDQNSGGNQRSIEGRRSIEGQIIFSHVNFPSACRIGLFFANLNIGLQFSSCRRCVTDHAFHDLISKSTAYG